MQTTYIYSASRVNTLAQYLLTKTDIERLLVAEPGEDLQSALKETYLAPYVAQVDSDHVPDAIEQTLIEAKQLIHRIAPNGDMFRVLWLQYDIHNLRVFSKAASKGLSFEGCAAYCSERGIYDPEYLYNHANEGTLNRLQSEWQEAYDEAIKIVSEGSLDKVDIIFDTVFFETAKRIATTSGDTFINTYLRGVIDMFNLKARLRSFNVKHDNASSMFISGGNFRLDEMDSKEQVYAAFQKVDGQSFWNEALEFYQETGNTTQIDARVDEYLLTLARQASFDMFSSASLVLYYLQCRQSAANVRTIVVGKNSGMSEEDIRSNLRLAYVN